MPTPEHNDPFSLEQRGIERLSVVYGIVPVHEDGRPYLQYLNRSGGDWPRPKTPRAVRKGIVANAEARIEDRGLVLPVLQVAWQTNATGRAALSRGINRWPTAAEVFTPEEVAAGIEAAFPELIKAAGGHMVYEPPKFSPEFVTGHIDGIVENPLGNLMLRGFLEASASARHEYAFDLTYGKNPPREDIRMLALATP